MQVIIFFLFIFLQCFKDKEVQDAIVDILHSQTNSKDIKTWLENFHDFKKTITVTKPAPKKRQRKDSESESEGIQKPKLKKKQPLNLKFTS